MQVFVRCFVFAGAVVGILGLNVKDLELVQNDIRQLLENQHGNIGQFVRLSWHDSGTYDQALGIGGSRACQRFRPGGEYADPANAGLRIPVDLLQPIHDRHTGKIGFADLWALAAVTGLSYGGGPDIPINFGRVDCASVDESVTSALPDADSMSWDPPVNQMVHLRDVFHRMGFDDRGIVALSGAHVLGRCHTEMSGYDGPWTKRPTIFSNQFYRDMLRKPWPLETLDNGLIQAFTPSPDDDTMMLLSDLALTEEQELFQMCIDYADDQDLFFQHFRHYFRMLQEGGHDVLYRPTNVLLDETFGDLTNVEWYWNSDAVLLPEDESFDGSACVVISLSTTQKPDEEETVEGKQKQTEDPRMRYELKTEVASESVEFLIWFSGTGDDGAEGEYVGVTFEDAENEFFDISLSGGSFAVSESSLWIPFKSEQWYRVFVNFEWEDQSADVSVTQVGASQGTTAAKIPLTEKATGLVAVNLVNSWLAETAKFDGVVISDALRQAPPVDRDIVFDDPILPAIPGFDTGDDSHEINGDRVLGWALQYSNTYDDVLVKPNDTLLFDYGVNHNVWRFDDAEAYELCDLSEAQMIGSNSDGRKFEYAIPLEDSGQTFGIVCETIGHCNGGMQFRVTVSGDPVSIAAAGVGAVEAIAIVIAAGVIFLLGIYVCYRQKVRKRVGGMNLDTTEDGDYIPQYVRQQQPMLPHFQTIKEDSTQIQT